MPSPTPAPSTDQLTDETVNYENVRVVIVPEAPYHYQVKVSEPDGERAVHAVEHVLVNATEILLDDPIWFAGAELDVGVPIGEPGDTAWVWP